MKFLDKVRAAYYYVFKHDELERPWDIRTSHLGSVNKLNPFTGKFQEKEWDWSQMGKPKPDDVTMQTTVITLAEPNQTYKLGFDDKAGPWGM